MVQETSEAARSNHIDDHTIVVWFHRKLQEAITATEMVSMLRWMIFRYRSIKLERFQFVGRERNLILWCTLTDEAQPSLELSYLSFLEHKVIVVQ